MAFLEAGKAGAAIGTALGGPVGGAVLGLAAAVGGLLLVKSLNNSDDSSPSSFPSGSGSVRKIGDDDSDLNEKESDDTASDLNDRSSDEDSDMDSLYSSSSDESSDDISLRLRLEKVLRMIRDGSYNMATLTSEFNDLIHHLLENGYRVTRVSESGPEANTIVEINSPDGHWFIRLDDALRRMLDVRGFMAERDRRVRCQRGNLSYNCMNNSGFIIYAIECLSCDGVYYVGQTDREHKRLCREHPIDIDKKRGQLTNHMINAHPGRSKKFDGNFEIIILYIKDEKNKGKKRHFEIYYQWFLGALQPSGGMSKR